MSEANRTIQSTDGQVFMEVIDLIKVVAHGLPARFAGPLGCKVIGTMRFSANLLLTRIPHFVTMTVVPVDGFHIGKEVLW